MPEDKSPVITVYNNRRILSEFVFMLELCGTGLVDFIPGRMDFNKELYRNSVVEFCIGD